MQSYVPANSNKTTNSAPKPQNANLTQASLSTEAPQLQKVGSESSVSHIPSNIAQLQQTIGNRAVAQLVKSRMQPQSRAEGVKPTLQAKGLAIHSDQASNGVVIQRAARKDLITWSQGFAGTAEYKEDGTVSDYVKLRFVNQTVGVGSCNLEFHIHLKGGEVSTAYAGSLFEVGKRPEGDLQSQDEAALNKIVDQWKLEKEAQGITSVRTPESQKASATREKEAEGNSELQIAAEKKVALGGVQTGTAITDREFVTDLLTKAGEPLSLVNFELRMLTSNTKTREDLIQIYKDRIANKEQEAAKKAGFWRKV